MDKPSQVVRGPLSAALPPRALEALEGSGLAGVIERVRWLDALDPVLRQSLPPTLADHCKLANVDEKYVVFLVSAPVWKAKLRLHADTVLAAAAAAGLKARTLMVKVSAPDPDIPSGSGPVKPLSEAVRDALRTTALSVSDPGLREQLLKLAGASRSSTDDA